VLVAYLFAVAFAFVFKQIADAPLDALGNTASARSNPIATGELPLPAGRISALLLAVTSLVLFALLSWKAFLAGFLLIILGVLYSWDGVRLKGVSLLDLAEHAWLLATPLFLTSYFAQNATVSHDSSFLLLSVLFISLFGQLSHENHNIPKLELSHPRQAVLLRERHLVHLLIIFCLAAGIATGGLALLALQVIPLRVTILWALLSLILLLPSFLRAGHSPANGHSHPPLHKELEKAAAYALLASTLAEIFIQNMRW
jgi:4-hydroxybenzoate polyprenyltransferase